MMLRFSLLCFLFFVCQSSLGAENYFAIHVIDQETGRGVPLVELQTVNNIRLWTDSNGFIAFQEPGLMGQTVYFHIRSHGYEYRKDGFGFRGVKLKITPGGKTTIKIKRINIAERLYRITGGGIYRDSVLLGEKVPLREPVLNGQVFGQDSVINAAFKGKMYWFWGDTNRPSYPLGNYFVPGALTDLPTKGGLDPEVGVNLNYFLDADGFAKATAKMPGPGPCWINGLVVLNDKNGGERMFGQYVRVEKDMKVFQRGLVEFNDEKKQFEKIAQFDMNNPLYPGGHTFQRIDKGQEHVYFANAYPLVRVAANVDSLKKLEKYEVFTCLKNVDAPEAFKLDRLANGKLRYAWRSNAPLLSPQLQDKLIKAGKMKAAEGYYQLRDVETGKGVQAHGGSVYWNDYRRRWVMIATQSFGESSFLGEVWYAEADRPEGPWIYARKIVTHDRYSFYNPKQHPLFDKENGRIIFFEGTYTTTFSGNKDQTPRYDYNQIMYKLDLQNSLLVLPVAIYESRSKEGKQEFADASKLEGKTDLKDVRFYALDRPVRGTVAIHPVFTEKGVILEVGPRRIGKRTNPVFHALPSELKNPPANVVPLFTYFRAEGEMVYSTNPNLELPGYRRQQAPLCFVWENQVDFVLQN